MEQLLTGQLSCPKCGARAMVRARACADCGYRFLDDAFSVRRTPTAIPANRVRLLAVALAAAVAAVAPIALALRGTPEAADRAGDRRSGAAGPPAGPELLSRHPLSTRAAERRLQSRFGSLFDDYRAAVSCAALEPRPAHAIRRCRVSYPGGIEGTVIVLTNPRGHELVIEP